MIETDETPQSRGRDSLNGKRALPEGWKWVRLGDVCEFMYGSSLPSQRRQAGEVPVYGSNGIVGHHDRALTSGPTIVIGRKGSIGEVNYSPVPCWPIDTTYFIERPKVDCDMTWLVYLLLSLKLQTLNKAAAVPGLNREDAYALTIPFPPFPEQQRLAALLTEQMAAVERARAAAEAQLEAAKQLPAAYLRAVFDSEEARSWPQRRLGDVCAIQLGKMLSPASKTGIRSRSYLRNANVQWGHFDLTDIAHMDFTEAEEVKFALRAGDLLVCEGGEPGRAAVWNGQISPCYYQKALHRLRPIDRSVDPTFIMYRLWMGALRGEFLESHAQTTIAHLPAIRLQELPLGVPPLTDQQRIATQLSEQMETVERTRSALQAQLDAINALPAALLRRAFMGAV